MYVLIAIHKSIFIIRHKNAERDLKCNFCHSGNITRTMSRFASLKSNEDRLESLANPGKWSGVDENMSRSAARFAEEMGQDVSRNELDQMADKTAHETEPGLKSSDKSGMIRV